MNKSEIVNRVTSETQVTRDAAEAVVGAVFSAIGEGRCQTNWIGPVRPTIEGPQTVS